LGDSGGDAAVSSMSYDNAGVSGQVCATNRRLAPHSSARRPSPAWWQLLQTIRDKTCSVRRHCEGRTVSCWTLIGRRRATYAASQHRSLSKTTTTTSSVALLSVSAARIKCHRRCAADADIRRARQRMLRAFESSFCWSDLCAAAACQLKTSRRSTLSLNRSVLRPNTMLGLLRCRVQSKWSLRCVSRKSSASKSNQKTIPASRFDHRERQRENLALKTTFIACCRAPFRCWPDVLRHLCRRLIVVCTICADFSTTLSLVCLRHHSFCRKINIIITNITSNSSSNNNILRRRFPSKTSSVRRWTITTVAAAHLQPSPRPYLATDLV